MSGRQATAKLASPVAPPLEVSSETVATALNQKKVDCPLRVGGETLPQVEKF